MPHPGSTTSLARLVDRLQRLPGIGTRSAQRLAFHLLKSSPQEAEELAATLRDLHRQTLQCSHCRNIAETDPCSICTDPRRDQGLILVVEQPNDVVTFEATGLYHGVYHVLMGRLAPLEGLGPGELTIQNLLDRVRQSSETPTPVREIILGTHPTLEGDGTSLYLARELQPLGVKISRLARGLPTGYTLDIAPKSVLADAIFSRQPMTS